MSWSSARRRSLGSGTRLPYPPPRGGDRLLLAAIAVARLAALLLAVWGVFSALLAVFPDDPLGTPATARGAIHLVLALVAFLGALVGTILLSLAAGHLPPLQRVRGWLLALSLLAVVPLLALLRAGFRAESLGGLDERIFLALELAWILVTALTLARRRQLEVQEGTRSAG